MTDPDLDRLDQGAGTSKLDLIKAEMRTRREKTAETFPYRITRWPDWVVTYRLPATAEEIEKINKAVAKELRRDPAAGNRLMLARCCVAISIDGEDQVEDDGSASTWASAGIRDALGARSSTEALTIAYRGGIPDGPGDGEISEIAHELVTLAGFGDSSQVWRVEQDPTQGP